MFASSHPRRFNLPGRSKKPCCKLKDDETVITDLPGLLDAWKNHFSNLAQSGANHNPDLAELQTSIESLVPLSMENEEYILDVPFTVEEVEKAIKRLKRRKAPGPDNLLAEHLIEGGQCVAICLTNILNAIIDLEVIPDSFKFGLVVPVYKGSGKDPLKTDSYRGITLSPVFSKVLEFLILDRLDMVFMEASVPHMNQSAYKKRVSCADAIFASQEVIARYLRGGSTVYMCLYDLHKAFDSIEYPVLLKRLYDLGVNGKCWRIIRSWYENASCKVKLEEGVLSESYSIGRGVKQGSVLSPALFLLVMDPLLSRLQSSGMGLSINNFYAGGFLHADDIRTAATSPVR